MQVWLNDLKPGDSFWICDSKCPKCLTIVGPAHNRRFAMSRWLLSDGSEMFVNTYVYTTKEEAIVAFLPKLRAKIKALKEDIQETQAELDFNESVLKEYERCIN